MRHRVSRELKQAEANYWKYKLKEVEKGSSDFWRLVKDITNTERKKEKQIVPIRSESGNLLISDKQIAESMNTFFTNIGEKLVAKFETSKEVTQYISKVTPTISDLHFRIEKFTEKFNMLHPMKADGHDNITTKELKLISKA